MIHMSELINRDNPPKRIYRDVRARFTDSDSDADIIVKLEVTNNLLMARLKTMQIELDNLKGEQNEQRM